MTNTDKLPKNPSAAESLTATKRMENRLKQSTEYREKKRSSGKTQSPEEDVAALSPEEIQKNFQELRRTQAENEIAKARYFDLYDLSPVGYCTLSETETILQVNLAAVTLLGMPREALINEPFSRLILKEDQTIYYLHHKQYLENGKRHGCELRMVKQDGAVLWVHLTTTAMQQTDGGPEYLLVLRDITDRKRTETYREISREVHGLLYNFEKLSDVIQHVLHVMKERTGFDAVGIRLQRGDDFPYFAQKGFSQEFLLMENSLTERTRDGEVCQDKDGNVRLECTCGLVISGKTDPTSSFFTSGGSFWINDSAPLLEIPPSEDPRLHPRNQCIHLNYASVALVPIRDKDRVVGLIQFNDHRKGCFTLDSIKILEGIASHIGSALIRRQAEMALRENEVKYRSLFENMIDGFALHQIIVDETGKPIDYIFREVNSAFEKLTGLKAEDVVNKNVTQALPGIEKDPFDWIGAYGKVALTGNELRFEQYSEQLKRWYAVVAYRPMQNYFATVFEDITERKHTEQELRKSEERLRLAQESATVGIWDWKMDTGSLDFTPELNKLYGLPPGAIKTYQDWRDRVHLDDIGTIETRCDEAIAKHEPFDLEFRALHSSGEYRWIATKGGAIYDGAGTAVRVLGVNIDISRLKQVEEDRSRLLAEIKAALAEKEVLLKEIHHRVKNNLQVISSLVSLQANCLTDEGMRNELNDVQDRIRSMALIHEKLYHATDLARLNFSEYATSLLHSLWHSHGTLAARARLNLVLSPVEFSIEAAVPCGLLLNELAGNALKHAFPNGSDGEVTVGLEHDPTIGTVCLRVRDNGVGLPEGLDWRQTKSLGLRLVQILVGQLRGTVETGTGPGAEFRVTFPLNGLQS